MIAATKRATLDDLHHAPTAKAELIGGSIVPMMATGHLPGKIAFRIARRLADHVDKTGKGVVHTDNVGYAVSGLKSGRESFCPDVSYFEGAIPDDPMDFIHGPPTVAIEVRSKGDYGPAAEFDLAAKRDDYFEAGTRVVWDVDPMAERIHIYRIDARGTKRTLGRGDVADAEPALPGWRIPIDVIFEK